MPNPIRITYSISAIPTWVRAVILIPITAMTRTISPSAVSMPILPQVLFELLPKAAKTVGARISTPLIVPRI